MYTHVWLGNGHGHIRILAYSPESKAKVKIAD